MPTPGLDSQEVAGHEKIVKAGRGRQGKSHDVVGGCGAAASLTIRGGNARTVSMGADTAFCRESEYRELRKCGKRKKLGSPSNLTP